MSTIHGVDRKIAVLHQLSQPLVDCPHVTVKLLIRCRTVAVGEEYDKVILRIGADELYIVLDLDCM